MPIRAAGTRLNCERVEIIEVILVEHTARNRLVRCSLASVGP